ncbi:MAG TPA: VacJ family lipoprotein [Rhodocyclaceae bacterium]|nr:VacJ family lipoprotein [Rhodocyclaceae bacterium]
MSTGHVSLHLCAIGRFARSALTTGCLVGLLAACAGTPPNPKDPLEGFNRAMFSFNEGLDQVLIRPVAQGYEAAVPLPARIGVSNFFGNVGDLWVGINNLLQGKGGDAANDVGRLLINSTLGILGLFDVASEMGLERHDEDFGQTLGRWGVGEGAYVVLPLFGPRTLRDTGGLVVDVLADPVSSVDDVPTRNTLRALRIVSARAELLPGDKAIEQAALDKYAYIRDAYLQRRLNLIHDGNPPREKLDSGAMGIESDPVVAEAMQAIGSFLLVSAKDVEVAASVSSTQPTE